MELVRDWNIGLPEYWGAVGHYTIANKAISAIRNKRLKKLMEANLDRITYDQAQITSKNMKGLSTRDYVPLADVPDMVWKVGPHKRGGMNSPEHPNHFADMDKPGPDGRTLLKITEEASDPLRSTPGEPITPASTTRVGACFRSASGRSSRTWFNR